MLIGLPGPGDKGSHCPLFLLTCLREMNKGSKPCVGRRSVENQDAVLYPGQSWYLSPSSQTLTFLFVFLSQSFFLEFRLLPCGGSLRSRGFSFWGEVKVEGEWLLPLDNYIFVYLAS